MPEIKVWIDDATLEKVQEYIAHMNRDNAKHMTVEQAISVLAAVRVDERLKDFKS